MKAQHNEELRLPSTTNGCVQYQQQAARDYLAGRTPGVMAMLAPDAQTGPDGTAGWQESDETVARLKAWREEAPYG